MAKLALLSASRAKAGNDTPPVVASVASSSSSVSSSSSSSSTSVSSPTNNGAVSMEMGTSGEYTAEVGVPGVTMPPEYLLML